EDVFLCKKTGDGKSICFQAYHACWTNLHGDFEKCEVSVNRMNCSGAQNLSGCLGSSENVDSPFRPWYSKLGEIGSLIDCPSLLIKATANKAARMKLKSMFCMKSCFEIIDNPDWKNISEKHNSFFMIQKFKAEKDTSERYIIFCQSIKSCSEIFTMFRLQLGLEIHYIEMFHSFSDEVKENVKKSMNVINRSIRIIVATSAAGMRVNFQGVKHVVNVGPPADIDSFVQQYGRAGGDGSFATGLLIYNAKQCKKYRHEKQPG
ncbi:RECQ-like protein, partial [Mya arenaria]